jgi:hypothetical protein
MHKKQFITKTCYKFSNDKVQMCFEHKTIMKVDHRIKNIKMILKKIMIFYGTFFVMRFLCLHMHIFSLQNYDLN